MGQKADAREALKAFLRQGGNGGGNGAGGGDGGNGDFLRGIVRGERKFDVVDNASNLIGNLSGNEGLRAPLTEAVLHALDEVARTIGFAGPSLGLFDAGARERTRAAADAAEAQADRLFTDKDREMALMSDAYSLVAVLFHGRLGDYADAPARRTVYEMAARFFAAAAATRISEPNEGQ